MKIVDVREIPPNAILARPIYSDSGVTLLSENTVITDEIIDRLNGYGVQSLWIRVEKQEANSFSSEAINDDIKTQIEHAISNKIHFDNSDEMKEIAEEAINVINGIIEDENVMQCMVDIKRKSDDIYSHMISTAVLSVIMAIKLKFNAEQVNNIGMGALLHDIGLCGSDMKFFNIEIEELDAQDKMFYRRHVIKGYELMNNYAWVPEAVKNIVLSHHEREDGSGYPFHKKADRISAEVKIVAICDYFDELVNGIGYNKRKIYEVAEYLRTIGAYLFDYNYVTKIISQIAWFPNGSKVVTNEGDTAIVLSQNKGLPDRPVIKLLSDSDGKSYEKEIIKDLTEHLTVFIVDTEE